ncbi:hypothetical protein [Oceanobacter mangrovi]|uniref:hypothetical protein n=1 Tax=Oceanobacter mangrovi TaxID=2862510 RepID=UPI001FE5D780|nr:hypothetical protein [Oceanobacter mangrovi]
MSPLLIKTAISALVRLAAVFIAFVLTAAVTRGLGAEQAGYFLLGFTLLTALSTFFRLGIDNVLVREFGANGLDENTQRTLGFGIKWVAAITILVGVIGAMSSGHDIWKARIR